MCEVLEHVEEPLALLRTLRKMVAPGGNAFISAPVNGPACDHIYLFRSIEDVAAMVREAGFGIVEQQYFLTKNRSLGKAVKYKDSILVAMLLK